MFQAIGLPAGITDLDTSLANVAGNTLMHSGYGLAGAGGKSRYEVPVTIPNKLRVEVSDALKLGNSS